MFDVVAIDKETMPSLYTYVESLCKAHNIKMPTIFITRDIVWKQGVFNACAQKLLTSTGAIVIGQKLLLETTNAELEAVVAHELGHIKYNHINKMVLIAILTGLTIDIINAKLPLDKRLGPTTSLMLGMHLPTIIINKRFEKQADEFAYKNAGKAEGTIAFHKDLIKREKNYNDGFQKTYDILQKSKPGLSLYDRTMLTARYYVASFGNKLRKAHRWIYHNTPYGAHPSSEARIKAVEDYLASTSTTAPASTASATTSSATTATQITEQKQS